jgi:DNA-binding response OmpR family regulator
VQKTPLLVVDDDAAIRKLLERIAQRAGFAVESARDGVEALEMMERKHYDIAIIDLMMPRLSGYELVQKVGEIENRPVLIVASAATNGETRKLDDTLVRRVITKPFDIDAVAKTLVETEAQIAEQRALAAPTIPVARAAVKTTMTEPEAKKPSPDAEDNRAPR